MKKIFTFSSILIFLLITNHSFSQAPNWMWAEAQTVGSCNLDTKGIYVAPSGNIYVGGRFGSTLTLNGATASTGGTEVYSAKMDSNGVFSWITPHPYGGGNDYDYGFGGDTHENHYVTGLIQGSNGLFVDKYNSAGVKVWNFSPASLSSNIGGYGTIGVDNSGNVYVTGGFSGTKTFATGITVTAIGSGDMFLAKLDSNGVCKWAVNAGAPGQGTGGRGVAVDPVGNVYVCGGYNGTAQFGSLTTPSVTTDAFFVAKYDTSGNALWVQTAKNAGFLSGAPYWQFNGITVDSCSNVYVTGHFENQAQFGPFSFTSKGDYDMFVAKCHFDGKWEWVQTGGGTGNDEAWAGVALDRNSDVYVTGYFSGTATFGGQTVTSAASSVYVAKYANSTGDLQWIQTATSGVTTYGCDLALDKKGHVYIAGTIGNGSATFGTNTITANSSCNIFYAKLDTAPVNTIVPTVDASYCPGASAIIPYAISGNFNAGNIFTAQLSDSTGSFVSPVNIGDSLSNTNGNINITIPQNTPSGSNYLIRVISSNPATSSYASGCGAYYKKNVYVNNFYVAIGGNSTLKVTNDTTLCSGNSINLNVSGGSNYTWTPTIALSCTNCANPLASPVSSQTYTVTANAGSACLSSASILINVLPGVNLTLSPATDTTICSSTSARLVVGGAATYAWSSSLPVTCSTCPTLMVTPIADTTVYLITGTSADGKCSSSGQISVYLGNNSKGGEIITSRDTICQNTPGRLTLTNHIGSPIQWQSSTDGADFTNVNTTDTTDFKTDPLSQTTWFKAVIGSGSCNATSDTLKLFVPPTLVSKFNYTASNLVATFNSDSSSGTIRTYSWNFGDNTSSGEPDPVHTYSKDTTYYVCLTLYDGSNCSYTFCRYISGLTGISTVIAADHWNVYPNPTTEGLSVSGSLMKDVYSIEMYDVLGRIVKNWDKGMLNSNPAMLNVSSLSKGMYYLKIHTDNADYIQKIVKE